MQHISFDFNCIGFYAHRCVSQYSLLILSSFCCIKNTFFFTSASSAILLIMIHVALFSTHQPRRSYLVGWIIILVCSHSMDLLVNVSKYKYVDIKYSNTVWQTIGASAPPIVIPKTASTKLETHCYLKWLHAVVLKFPFIKSYPRALWNHDYNSLTLVWGCC